MMVVVPPPDGELHQIPGANVTEHDGSHAVLRTHVLGISGVKASEAISLTSRAVFCRLPQDPIDRHPAYPERLGNCGRSVPSVSHIDDTRAIDTRLATSIFLTTQFGIADDTRDAFGLTFTADIRFELRENGEHAEERLAR
jgi:hypothetical protein